MIIYIAEHTCCTCGWTGLNRWTLFGFGELGQLWLCPECRKQREIARTAPLSPASLAGKELPVSVPVERPR